MERTKSKEISKSTVFHAVSVGILTVSLLLSIVRFPAVLFRTVQSFVDLATSIAYYFTELMGFYGAVTPTVNVIPDNAVEVLPFDPLEFQAKLQLVSEEFVKGENVGIFFAEIGNFMIKLCRWIPTILLACLLFYIIGQLFYGTVDNDYNEDSKPLKIYKKIEAATWDKLKRVFWQYVGFLSINRLYVILFALIWAYNLNFLTIVIEALAYVFYLSVSLDFLHIYTQIAKLAMDLTVSIDFLPTFVWIVIGYVIVDAIRQHFGLVFLRKGEEHNREFLDAHPGALFVVGKQRTGKTTLITDMALSQEQIFRDDALKGLLRRVKQFPYFPWQNLELMYKRGKANGVFPTLESCRRFVKKLKCFYLHREYHTEYHTRRIAKELARYGYLWEDYLFNYDVDRYGMYYNNGLTMIDLFEAIEAYLQQYKIYAGRTSLIFGNYAIRTDIVWNDEGNFPLYNGDFFERDPALQAVQSDFCHIIDMDALRLGKVMDDDGIYRYGMEYGVVNCMEYAKERGNQHTNAGKRADADDCNVRNDGYEENIKMKGHDATIDNVTYFKPFIDDQREDSLSAENKDLCDVIKIVDKGPTKIMLPFFFLEAMLGEKLGEFYDKHYLDDAHRRGSNTLLMYVIKKVTMPILHYLDRRINTYSVYTAKLKVWDGHEHDLLSDKDKYYVAAKKTYAGRFATDGTKDFYSKRAALSTVGIDEYPTFGDVRMTTDEMKMMHSYFYARLMKIFGRDGGRNKSGVKARAARTL